MSKNKKAVKVKRHIPVALILLGVIFIASMVLRGVLPYRTVFIGGGQVIFGGNDPWYHMRLAENMLHNFPAPLLYDQFTWFPGGSPIIIPPLMSWLIVAGGYMVSFGQPTIHTLQVVGAWMPPIIGSLVLIPVYFIGKEMHNKWTGVLAAALVALMPTGFLYRSMLGFTDHHVLEVLLFTTTMMFLMMGYRKGKLLYYALAGVALGLFHLAWHAAIFMMFVLWVWFIVQFVVDYLREGGVKRLCVGVAITFGIANVMMMPYYRQVSFEWIYKVAPLLTLATPLVLGLLAHYFKTRKQLTIALVVVGGTLTLGVWLISPGFFHYFWLIEYAISFAPAKTIAETMSLGPRVAFEQYGLNLVLCLVGMGMALREKQKLLLVVIWSMIVFLATSTQIRWDYYFAIVVGLMSAYFFTTLGVYFIKEVRRGISLVLCVALLFLTVPDSIKTAKLGTLMTEDWYNALVWLRENSPEPFQDSEAYYRLELDEEPAYGVLSWWDYGHWITKVSHRVPVANPFQQGAVDAANFFVDGTEIDGVRYVIVDNLMLTTKYYAILTFAGKDYAMPEAPQDSAIARLASGQLSGYNPVFTSNTVLIFEKVG